MSTTNLTPPPADGWWSRPSAVATTPPGAVAAGSAPPAYPEERPPYDPGADRPTGPVPDPWQTPGAPPASPVPAPRRQRRGPSWVMLVVAVLLAGLFGGLVGGWVARPGATEATGESTATNAPVLDQSQTPSRAPESVAGIAEQALPSVVSITTGTGTGSGFIITDDGYILTNNHVIADAATSGTVTVDLRDGRQAEASIVGRSPSYDLAVLDIDLPDLTPLALGDSSDVAVGDPVVAVGNPLGLNGTVTSGIISAADRPVTAGGSGEVSFINALQTLYDNPMVETELPSAGRLSLLHQPDKDRYVVHLLYGPPIQRGECEVIEDLPFLYDVPVTIDLPENIKNAILIPDGIQLEIKRDMNKVRVTVPQFQCHCGIVFEY